jgi:hypothetical protein
VDRLAVRHLVGPQRECKRIRQGRGLRRRLQHGRLHSLGPAGVKPRAHPAPSDLPFQGELPSGSFACSRVLDNTVLPAFVPAITVGGLGRVALPLTHEQAGGLRRVAEQAPFGASQPAGGSARLGVDAPMQRWVQLSGSTLPVTAPTTHLSKPHSPPPCRQGPCHGAGHHSAGRLSGGDGIKGRPRGLRVSKAGAAPEQQCITREPSTRPNAQLAKQHPRPPCVNLEDPSHPPPQKTPPGRRCQGAHRPQLAASAGQHPARGRGGVGHLGRRPYQRKPLQAATL